MELNRKILRIAIPSIVSNITVPLLGLVDVAITGHMGDARYMAAISVGAMMFNLIYWLFGFLRMGTSGLTSQALGARRLADATRLLARSLVVAEAIACLFLICQVPLRELMLTLMKPPAEVRSLASLYFSICIWGAPAVMALYGLNGWFIGMQNTRTPMVVAVVQNVVNIVASLFLVFVCGMRIEGVAAGTLIAQWTAFALALLLLCRHYRRLRPHFSWQGVVDVERMKDFFRVNRDIFLRTCFLVAVNFAFTAAGSRQGAILLSVNTMLMQFFLFFSYFMDGFANAGEALAGRAYGARNHRALRLTVGRLFAWGAATTALFTLAYLMFGHLIIRLLTDNPDVVAAARPYFFWVLVVPAAGMAAFVWDGVFVGLTATRGMLVACACAATLFFAIILLNSSTRLLPENHALWMAQVIFLATRSLVQTAIFRRKSLKSRQ